MRDRLARNRPRPVADAPVATLVERAQELAKQWLLELVALAPLDAAAAVPVAELAREAPALCAAAVRALASDDELARISPEGELAGLAARAGRLAGAADAAAAVAAIEALRRTLWSAIGDELRRPGADQVAELAERLAHVCALIAIQCVDEHEVAAAGTQGAPAGAVPEPDEEQPLSVRDARGEEPPRRAPAIAGRLARHDVDAPPGDARGDAPPWIGAIAARLKRRHIDGLELTVLAIELDAIDRLLAAETGHQVALAIERVERALEAELRPADTLVRESLGRYWLIAPDTGRVGAQTLAERLAAAVQRAASHRRSPLTAAVGIAVCPEDGEDADTLTARAQEGVFAARAAGVGVASAAPNTPS